MYTMQENTFINEAYFRSYPFAINHIWNFDVGIQAASAKTLEPDNPVIFQRIFVKFKMQIF
jgi:hypothetical protein